MKNFIYIFSFTLILLLASSCNGKDDPILVKEDITLSETELLFKKQDESAKTVTIKTEEQFQLDKHPDWLILEVDQTKKTIEISPKPNYSKQPREVLLKVSDSNSESYLKITQLGQEEEKEPFSFLYFPISGVSHHDITEANGKTSHHFKSQSFFISQKIKNDIYLGNVLNYKFSSIDKVQTFEDYQFSNVTILPSTIINGKLYIEKWERPSKEQMDNLAKQIIDANPSQNMLFSSGSPLVFRSYNYLHFLSMANLGFGMEDIMFDNTSTEKTMKKDVGLIYSYNQSLFSLILDYSSLDRKEMREETDFIKENNLSYINTVTYGRTAFLVVEFDGSDQNANFLIGKVSRKNNLTESEKSLINGMNVYYLYFSSDGTLQKDKSTDNIEKITNYFKAQNNHIIPLSFSVGNYVNHGMRDVEYTITSQMK